MKLYISCLTLLLASNLAYADKLTIKIEGLKEQKAALTNVQNALSIYEYQNREAPAPLRVEWLNAQAPEEITMALEPYGFYRPTIETDLKKEGDTWIATYKINPKDPIKIHDLIFEIEGEGNRKRIFKTIIKDSDLRLEAPLNQVSYEKMKTTLYNRALSLGYFDVTFPMHEIIVNLDTYKSLVHLAMDTGDRYKFGAVTFHSEYFSEKLLRRYLNINTETEFSDTRTLELQEDLDAADYFEEVIIAPTIDHQSKTVPLDITVTPKKKRVFSAGIGYSTDIGMRLSGLGTWRYINRMGHKFNIDLLLAQKQRRAVFNYRIPGKRPATSFYDIYFKYNYEDTKYRDYTALIVGASSTHKKDGFKQVYALDYRNDKFRTPDGFRRHSQLLVPSATFSWDNIVNPLFEDWVIKGSVMVRGSAKAIGSDVNFVQVKAEGTAAIPITQNDRVILRGQMGHTFIDSKDLYYLSPALLFQTGGDNSVRGYRYGGIGERGYKDNEIYGGKKLIVGSFEWEHKFTKEWAGVAFVDAGDAFNGGQPNLKFGAGFGVRWFSQIGIVKFDIAHGFDKDYGDTIRFHLNIGKEI